MTSFVDLTADLNIRRHEHAFRSCFCLNKVKLGGNLQTRTSIPIFLGPDPVNSWVGAVSLSCHDIKCTGKHDAMTVKQKSVRSFELRCITTGGSSNAVVLVSFHFLSLNTLLKKMTNPYGKKYLQLESHS
jgi:hypothetical protein